MSRTLEFVGVMLCLLGIVATGIFLTLVYLR